MCRSNAFSGQKLFTEGSIQLYNVLFTTAPLLLFGMWDRDVSYEHALKVGLYRCREMPIDTSIEYKYSNV